MWEMFAVASPIKGALCAAIFLLLSCCAVSGQQHVSVTAQGMYFVAGTPTNKSPETYAVTLYAGRSDKELNYVRTVVSKDTGLYWVFDDLQNSLAVAYPHVNPSAVSIIHEDDPGREDIAVFNPKLLNTIDDGTAITEESGRTYVLFPVTTSNAEATRRVTLIKVLSSPDSKDRVTEGKIEDYSGIRVAGVPGGPAFGVTPSMAHVDNGIYATLDQQRSKIVDLSGLNTPVDGADVDILAASTRFFAFYPSKNMDQVQGLTSRVIFVYDILKHSWKQIMQPGNLSRTRLCGPWLVTIQQQERDMPAGEIRARPFDKIEVNEQGETPELRREYGSFQGAISYIPGILIMDNLEDGRKVVIDTGREDSEVLLAEEDSVTYRINEEIYHAEIRGSDLREPTLIIKSKEVPEIHWAFSANSKR
jgi:hypothetical protein